MMEDCRHDGLISAAVNTLPLGPQQQDVLLYRPAVVQRKNSLSSTPHAPRHKRETPFLRALQQRSRTQKRQEQYSHQLVTRHGFMGSNQMKSWSTSTLPHAQQVVPGIVPHEAWNTAGDYGVRGNERLEQHHVKRVRPFRRTVEPLAPEGVPVLDLSSFNEPDHLMPPVEIIPSTSHLQLPCRTGESVRSDLSWGTAQIPSILSVCSLSEEKEQMEKEHVQTSQDGGDDSQKERSSVERHLKEPSPQAQTCPPPLPLKSLQESKLQYVENKVLSHERGKFVEKSIGSKGLLPHGVGEHGLSRRLRFGARVLSQNGRDVHRELCGFMFLTDGSLTIYEFRQFGQRSSALPLVPRAVYHHPVGRRRGDKYEMCHIKKGATLFFETSWLTSLPESLSQRPYLAVRITDVDEKSKWNLMTEGLKPSEYHRVRMYLSQFPSEESTRARTMFLTLQGMLYIRLRGRASRTLVGLGRLLRQMGKGAGTVSRVQLQQALRAFHISLTPEDYSQLWRLLSDDGRYTNVCQSSERGKPHCDTNECSSGGREGMYSDQVIAGLLGEMSEDRKFFVRKVFAKLDPSKSGSIQVTNIHKYFISSCHPDVLAGKMAPEEAHFALLSCLQPPSTQPSLRTETSTVPYSDFENYYEGVSIETASDHDFIHLLQQCWSV